MRERDGGNERERNGGKAKGRERTGERDEGGQRGEREKGENEQESKGNRVISDEKAIFLKTAVVHTVAF